MPESNQKLRSEAVQDILTKVPHWMIMWGNTIMLLIVVMVFVLASLIKYPDVIEVDVKITFLVSGDDRVEAEPHLVAQLNVPVSKASQIKTGQIFHIKLIQYPHENYGVLKGEIPTVSAVIPDQEGFYPIIITLGDKLITTRDIEISAKNDMYGNGEIFTEKIALIDRIFYRFRHIFS